MCAHDREIVDTKEDLRPGTVYGNETRRLNMGWWKIDKEPEVGLVILQEANGGQDRGWGGGSEK